MRACLSPCLKKELTYIDTFVWRVFFIAKLNVVLYFHHARVRHAHERWRAVSPDKLAVIGFRKPIKLDQPHPQGFLNRLGTRLKLDPRNGPRN